MHKRQVQNHMHFIQPLICYGPVLATFRKKYQNMKQIIN